MFDKKNLRRILNKIQEMRGISNSYGSHGWGLSDKIKEKVLDEVNKKEIIHRMLVYQGGEEHIYDSYEFCFFVENRKPIDMSRSLTRLPYKIHIGKILDRAKLDMDKAEKILENVKQTLKSEIEELILEIEKIKKKLEEVEAVICLVGESKWMETVVYYLNRNE